MQVIVHLFLQLLTALVTALFGVYWGSTSHDTVTVKAPGLEKVVEECLLDGLEARMRFEIRLCRRYAIWFDSCSDSRAENHTISFDTITESYRVVSDRFGDASAPVAVGIPSKAEAMSSALTVEGVAVTFLARGDEKFAQDPAAYIQVRGTFSCKGSVNRTLARLSQIFTLGIVNAVEATTDWYDFEIASGVATLPS
jgi:hypothetical protein